MASYPNSIPSFPTPGATLASPSHSALHSSADGEIVAICTELGTLPKGGYSSVSARLTGIESSIVGTGHTQNTDLGTTSSSFYIGGTVGSYIYNVADDFHFRNDTNTAFVSVYALDVHVSGNITDGVNSVTVSELEALTLDSHTHANKATLDTYNQSNVNLTDSVAKKHTQNTDTGTDVETFQLNNVNPLSSRIKVDDLTPQYVDIRNGADSQFADIRALHFRGELAPQNLDSPAPSIRYNDSANYWELSNNGTIYVAISAGTSLAGVAGNVQFNGTTNLAADPLFTYDDVTNTLTVPNLVATVTADIAGTISNTFTINTDGFYVQIDTAGMGANRVVNGEDLYQSVQQRHNAATAGTGISVGGGSGQVITNSDLGTAARTAHELAYDHTAFMDDALTSAYIWVGNGTNVATAVAMSGDVTIDNTGATTVANNSHTHNNTTVTLALDDLSDTTITAPTVDHILRYNGAAWVNGPETNVNSGSGVDYFPDTTASDIGGYASLNRSPQNVAEQDYTAVCNNNTVLIEEFASPVAGLGGTQIDAGVWTFDIWAYASLLTLASNIQIEVYKRTTVPVETLLFTVTSPTLTGTLDPYSVISYQQAFAINSDDRLVIKVYGVTLNVTNTTVHYAFGGTTHYSHVNTPLVVRHNDLAGLQGGSGTERYHMTLAQNTALHAAATAGTGIGVAGQVISLNHLGIQNLTDPGADRLLIWDDTDGYVTWLTLGTNLTYTHATHTLSATGGATLTRATFTNASLSAGVLTITHSAGLSAPYSVMVVIFDNNYQQIVPDSITGATNSVAVDLSSYVTAGGGSIAGTWGYGYIA